MTSAGRPNAVPGEIGRTWLDELTTGVDIDIPSVDAVALGVVLSFAQQAASCRSRTAGRRFT